MTVRRQPIPTSPRGSWVCNALTPVIFAVITAIGLTQQDETGGNRWWAKAVVVAVCVAAPIAGLILGIRAHRNAERTGAAAAVVAAVLLVAMPVALFTLVI